jgi:hypothetical protein
MDLGFWLGWGGAILGSMIGVAGGIFGTWASIRHTQTAVERAFMVRCAIGTWLFVGAFLLGLFLIPSPYNYLLWIPYPILLILGIRWMNARQAELRRQESTARG